MNYIYDNLNKMKNKTIKIAIKGPVAAGKTTFLSKICDKKKTMFIMKLKILKFILKKY